MNKTIDVLSAKKYNIIKDYVMFSHTKNYLLQKSGPINYFFKNQVDEIRKIAKVSGYKDFNQFIKHRKKWHELERKIPLPYLEKIGAEIEVLKFTVQLDIKNYIKTLEIPRYPEHFTVRMMPAFYQSRKFDQLLTEKEAIEFVKKFSNKNDKICWINYHTVKTITVFPEGRVDEIYYKPGIKIKSDYVIPTTAGKDIGKVKIL